MAQRFCTHCGARIDGPQQRCCTQCGQALVEAGDAPTVEFARASQAAAPSAHNVQGEGGRVHSPLNQASPMPQPGASRPDTSGLDRMADAFDAYDGAGDASGFRRQGSFEPATAQMAPVDGRPGKAMPVPGASSTSPVQPASGKGANTAVAAAIIAAALIIAVAVVLAVLRPWDGGSADNPPNSPAESSSATSSSVQPSSASSDAVADSTSGIASDSTAASPEQPASSSASSSAGPTGDEMRIHDTLASVYGMMDDYDRRISECAATFNNTYLSTDMSLRNSNAKNAQNLRDELSQGIATLKGLPDADSSRYSRSYSTILQLQQDLYNRIDVICQAWDLSLRYADPREHSKEILAPIAKDNDAKGMNIYKKDFDNLYPDARP